MDLSPSVAPKGTRALLDKPDSGTRQLKVDAALRHLDVVEVRRGWHRFSKPVGRSPKRFRDVNSPSVDVTI